MSNSDVKISLPQSVRFRRDGVVHVLPKGTELALVGLVELVLAKGTIFSRFTMHEPGIYREGNGSKACPFVWIDPEPLRLGQLPGSTELLPRVITVAELVYDRFSPAFFTSFDQLPDSLESSRFFAARCLIVRRP